MLVMKVCIWAGSRERSRKAGKGVYQGTGSQGPYNTIPKESIISEQYHSGVSSEGVTNARERCLWLPFHVDTGKTAQAS